MPNEKVSSMIRFLHHSPLCCFAALLVLATTTASARAQYYTYGGYAPRGYYPNGIYGPGYGYGTGAGNYLQGVASVQDASGNNIPLGTATLLPSGALLTINANGTFDYNPNGVFNSLLLGQTATDTFTYKVVDNFGETSINSATVTITINGTA